MKIVRLGNTESHLLFITYVLRNGNEIQYIKQQLTNMLKSFTN